MECPDLESPFSGLPGRHVAANPKTEGVLMRVAEIPPFRIDEMFDLMERYYEHVTRTSFLADLAEKQWVIMLTDMQTNALQGFSTQRLLDVEADGAPVKALFSGDTIVSRDRWGETALAYTWARLALSLMDRHAPEPLYWFLISKGYKTYRFLPLFFREFYPRFDLPTPAWAKRIIDALGRHKFSSAYDAAAGIVRAGPCKDRLRPGVADLTAGRLRDPHVRFFAERNPGHVRGEELCCLARLARNNITRAA
ncbi:MAG: hypothetical protein ABSG53_31065, partial [Thermoguttaceae bacterium]